MGTDKRPAKSGKITRQDKKIGVPAIRPCPQCSGTGKVSGKSCLACGGIGRRRQ